MTHMHLTSWILAIILFFVAAALYKSGKTKPAKITHMITRVLYLAIIGSGFALIGSSFGFYAVKMIVGIIVIGLIEMVLVRTSKGKSTGALWIAFVIAFVVVLYLGLSLPQGFSPFA